MHFALWLSHFRDYAPMQIRCYVKSVSAAMRAHSSRSPTTNKLFRYCLQIASMTGLMIDVLCEIQCNHFGVPSSFKSHSLFRVKMSE